MGNGFHGPEAVVTDKGSAATIIAQGTAQVKVLRSASGQPCLLDKVCSSPLFWLTALQRHMLRSRTDSSTTLPCLRLPGSQITEPSQAEEVTIDVKRPSVIRKRGVRLGTGVMERCPLNEDESRSSMRRGRAQGPALLPISHRCSNVCAPRGPRMSAMS